MTKLKKEFEEFYDSIKLDFSSTLKGKRDMLEQEIKEKFPEKCEDKGIDVKKSDLNFIYQGSYKINTTIKDENKPLDIDVAMSYPLDIAEHDDPRTLKQCLRNALNRVNRTVVIKRPCITIKYHEKDEEVYHVDFPMYAVSGDNYYLALGKEFAADYEWEEADPKGLNEYFSDRMTENPEIRRITRFLKRWRDEKFDGNSNGSVPSIALTILACQHFSKYTDADGNYDELRTLYHVVKGIKDSVPWALDEDGELQVLLPVKPYADTMFKINSNKDYRKSFVSRINYFEKQLSNALNSSTEHEAGNYVTKVLGSNFPVPEKEVVDGANTYGTRAEFG